MFNIVSLFLREKRLTLFNIICFTLTIKFVWIIIKTKNINISLKTFYMRYKHFILKKKCYIHFYP